MWQRRQWIRREQRQQRLGRREQPRQRQWLHPKKDGSSPGRGLERGTICCSANWIDPRSDKPRANLLCAFTGGRDEGVALLTNELERRGLSGLIRCPQSAILGKTYDDEGARRSMSIHKVFTLDDHLKEGLWPPGSGGEQEWEA